MFCNKGVLIIFSKFTGKHLCQCLLFDKAAGLKTASLLKKKHWHICFPVNFVKFQGTPFLRNTSGGCFWKQNKHYIAEIFIYTVFLRNTFSKAGSMFLKISSIWAWNVSSKLNLFSIRDGVYSLSMILSVYFDVKKPLGLKHL